MTRFVPFLLWLLLFGVLFLRRPWPLWRKIAGGFGLCVLIFPYHLLRGCTNYQLIDGVEKWPYAVWLAAQFLYCCAAFQGIFAVLELLLYYTSKRYCRKTGCAWRYPHYRIRIFCGTLLCSVLLSAAGISSSLMEPPVREYSVELENYPAGAGELRIAAVSDLHFDPVYGHRYAARIVDLLNSLKPHVIFLLGDFTNTRDGLSDAVLAELKKLSAPEGVYAVTGNHEYYPEGRENFRRIDSIGISFLCNESLKLKNFDLYLAGVNDPWAKTLVFSGFNRESYLPEIPLAVRKIPKGKPVILLCHKPQYFEEAASNGVGLQFSGHFHGGLFPVLHWLFALTRHYNSGLYTRGKAKMILSSGTGIWCGFPCRLGIRGEVLLVKVRRSR